MHKDANTSCQMEDKKMTDKLTVEDVEAHIRNTVETSWSGQLARQLSDTMRENERLKNEVERMKYGLKRGLESITSTRIAIMVKWQSIDTAPKTGEHILLYGSTRIIHDEPAIIIGYWDEELFMDGVEAHWVFITQQYSHFHTPTHWMPLPNEPNKQSVSDNFHDEFLCEMKDGKVEMVRSCVLRDCPDHPPKHLEEK